MSTFIHTTYCIYIYIYILLADLEKDPMGSKVLERYNKYQLQK